MKYFLYLFLFIYFSIYLSRRRWKGLLQCPTIRNHRVSKRVVQTEQKAIFPSVPIVQDFLKLFLFLNCTTTVCTSCLCGQPHILKGTILKKLSDDVISCNYCMLNIRGIHFLTFCFFLSFYTYKEMNSLFHVYIFCGYFIKWPYFLLGAFLVL